MQLHAAQSVVLGSSQAITIIELEKTADEIQSKSAKGSEVSKI